MSIKKYLNETGLARFIDKLNDTFLRKNAKSVIGEFTINANGDKVVFAPGNLQYKASTGEWRFAEHQWDTIGADNANISPTYDGWIDLFGYGCNGIDNGQAAYQPYSTSTDDTDYSYDDLTGTKDWGYVYTKQRGGDWRTLTRDEFNYIINTRNGHRFAKVQIAEQYKCLIIFPDNYTSTLNDINVDNAEFTTNLLTIAQASSLVNDGCTIIPCNGIRSGTNAQHFELIRYWTSSKYANTFNSWTLTGGASELKIFINQKNMGCSVRLVRDPSDYIRKDDITTGSANGTINVAGTDVAVNLAIIQSAQTSNSSSISYDFGGNNSIDTLTLTGSGSQTITINTIVAGYEHRMLLCNDTAVNKRIFIAKDSELTQTLLFPSSISVPANGYKLLRIVATDNHIICTLDNEIGTTQL